MSIAVNNYPQVAYSGVAGTPARAVKMFDAPQMKPGAAVLQFNWVVYFAAASAQYGSDQSNIAVPVDFSGGNSAQGGSLDKIVSVKIDNSNSYNSILVHFPDSGDTLACAPQTIVTLTACTNSNKCVVIAQGLTTGFLPLTTITFYNYFQPPVIDPQIQLVYPQWLGSPSIQREGGLSEILSPGFGPPALGDQMVSKSILMNVSGFTVQLLPAVAAGGFYTLTSVNLVCTNTLSGAESNTLVIERDGSGDIIFEWSVLVPGFSSFATARMNSLNLKFEADEAIKMRVAEIGVGSFNYLNMAYTYNPDR